MSLICVKSGYIERADLHTPNGGHYASCGGYTESNLSPTVIQDCFAYCGTV